ncbi:7,8-didemethyl-8-hydroxy-5-deazariboflavin synthase subunit CofG [Methanocella sp. CWC-04]|uniref:7,8-didemethyl-8-hydroxy-5-deazariboflavin synthase n=1 Tax=Methanooceanicella nereidis TaxID=2052831 RepID=A0AAP2REG8_9EURY|nr:7,8-didemethyl-8-hydroxy-5-deazariboflavin synthase subunit CofG [Methanocella sp. CWC-04]MCD1296224.1 7,8-didemethyl-8-hydroxy-5-deazariboflavin synthase subunit CofG [Methanocella sp. CWC-04]
MSENDGIITFTRNVFIPVTNMCRNNCAYCGFRRDIGSGEAYIMTPESVRETLRKAAEAGCVEALFTYGDAPDDELFGDRIKEFGYGSLSKYVYDLCLDAIELGLLPHTNGGVIPRDDLKMLGEVNSSMGLMLETTADLEAHALSPLKDPAKRIGFIEDAGRFKIPFTTGILVGIGETWADRKEALEVIAGLHKKYDHIQEVIVQNFVPKSYTRMGKVEPPSVEEMIKVLKMARDILPEDISLQAPPNLTSHLNEFLAAGAEDIGGISPVTLDYINPECRWPTLDELRSMGLNLRERLPIYPKYIKKGWYGDRIKDLIKFYSDEEGYRAERHI